MKIKPQLFTGGVVLLASSALYSCMDNAYDLSDIDTTVRLQTTELTVPINLDVLTLDQVMDIEDDGDIVKDIDPETGQRIYAIKREGTFNSDDITVNPFVIGKPDITPTTASLYLGADDLYQDIFGESFSAEVTGFYIIIPEDLEPAKFDASANDIDKAIHEVKGLGVETTFTTTLKVTEVKESLFGHMKFEKLILKLPAGLKASYVHKNGKEYPIQKDGTLDLSDIAIEPTRNGELKLQFDIDSIDATQGNIELNYDTHSLDFKDEIKIMQGAITMSNVEINDLPQSIGFELQPELDDIHIYSFSGEFEYDVEDFSIDPIDLTSLPDFLNQTGTTIRLENPQIYLSLNNPLNKYDVEFESGFQMTAVAGNDKNTYSPDNDQLIQIRATGKDSEGNYLPNEIVMSPEKPTHYYEGYTHPDHIQFTGLRDLLAETGDAIPELINVDVVNPKMPTQSVKDFHLGEDLEAVHGSYAFYAPLQLSEGSQIAYTDTIDGWNGDDVDAITLTKVVVEFDATTDLPYEVQLSIAPITFNAVDITESSQVTLEANATDQPVQLAITGTIKHLDGIKIKAKVISKNANVMSPDMQLYMKNSKITLSGYYEREL